MSEGLCQKRAANAKKLLCHQSLWAKKTASHETLESYEKRLRAEILTHLITDLGTDFQDIFPENNSKTFKTIQAV